MAYLQKLFWSSIRRLGLLFKLFQPPSALTSPSSSICLIPLTFSSFKLDSLPLVSPHIVPVNDRMLVILQPFLSRVCAINWILSFSFSSMEAMNFVGCFAIFGWGHDVKYLLGTLNQTGTHVTSRMTYSPSCIN
jgi:hypothetical protein